jgi:Ca2+-dependent lipid-binding protein
MSVVGTVTIEVVEAKDLPAMDFNLSADPYVRIGMFSDAFYTHRKNKTRSPVWNQAFEVELTEEKLEYHVEFEVIDYDEHTNNDSTRFYITTNV